MVDVADTRLVVVAFVIVAFPIETPVSPRFDTDRFVIVALVIVA